MKFVELRSPVIPFLAAMSCAILMATSLACGSDGSGGNGGSEGGDNLQIRSPFDDYGNAVTVDASGNVYIAGHLGEALSGQTYLGGTDAFVQKLDSSLAAVWTSQFGTDNNDSVETIAVDGAGNVYLAGSTIGEFPGYTTEYFGSDAFVRVYDANGTEQWTTQFGTEFATCPAERLPSTGQAMSMSADTRRADSLDSRTPGALRSARSRTGTTPS